MKHAVKWFVFNGLFVAAIYYGFYQGVEGAKNIALFWAWLNVVVSFVATCDSVVGVLKKKGRKRSVPAWLDMLLDLCVASAFAWYGHPILAAFWVVHMGMACVMWDKVEGKEGEPA